MAFVEFTGRVQLTDEHGLQTSKIVAIRVDDAIQNTLNDQLAAALDRLQEYASTLDDIVDPLITDVTLSIPAAPSGLKSVFGDQGVAEGANLVMSTIDADGNHERPYWLPGAKAGVFLPNFKTIDTADTQLIAWVESLENRTGQGTAITISDGEVVQAVNGGRYATRRRNSSA